MDGILYLFDRIHRRFSTATPICQHKRRFVSFLSLHLFPEALMHTWTIILAAAVGSAPLLVVLGRLARKHLFIPRYTILTDLLQLGTPRKGPRLTGRAVICGGRCARWGSDAASASVYIGVYADPRAVSVSASPACSPLLYAQSILSRCSSLSPRPLRTTLVAWSFRLM